MDARRRVASKREGIGFAIMCQVFEDAGLDPDAGDAE